MARCAECNKFVSYDQADPEVDNLEIEGNTVSATIRIVNNCDQCGTELREATLEPTIEVEIPDEHIDEGKEWCETCKEPQWVLPDGTHKCREHLLTVEEENSERTDRQEGKGRYAKTFYGATVFFSVGCSCGEMEVINGDLSDDIQASAMDEL